MTTQLLSPSKNIILIFLVALVLRLIFTSVWLEDWDSVQFALSLHDFSIIKHQPHPPGYPIYVLIGRFLDFFLKNPTQSLGLLSSFFGAATVIPIYLLTRKMFDQTTAVLASLLLIFLPVEWTLSEVALTNIPGLFFFSLLAYLIYKSLDNYKLLYLSSFLSGLILGIRFTEISILVALLTVVVIKQKIKQIFPIIGLFSLGILVWVIPVILLTGLKEFITSYEWIARYIINHDSALGQSRPFTSILTERIKNLLYLLKVGFTKYFVLLGSLATFIILIRKSLRNQWNYIFLIVWLFSYLIPLVFFFNLEVPRYTLPLSVPLVIITASIFTKVMKFKPLTLTIFISLLLVLIIQSWSQVTRFHKTVPPTIAAVNFVKEHFKPNEVVIIATSTYRQFQYYVPEYKTYYGDNLTTISIKPGQKIILDYLGSKEKIINWPSLVILETKAFTGDKDIFSRIPQVNLYTLSFSTN